MPQRKNNKVKSLYIHIPFCAHICAYCDFTKLIYNEKFAKEYVDVLLTELDSLNLKNLETIYIGGGTPTSLSDEDFEKVLKKSTGLLSENYEFTVEANVENLTESKLLLMKKYGVNRLSLGVESTYDKILEEIGRHHTFKDVRYAIYLARKHGFDNINVDLIYGLPNQTKELLKKDLEYLLKLETEHISIYSLIVSPGSMFYNKHVSELDEDTSREYYDLILKTMREHGYERYEISNFAKDGHYSRHNLAYWKDKGYCAVGLGASGYVNGIRYKNTLNLTEYLRGNYRYGQEEETIDENRHLEEYLLTNFRLEKGFLLEDFKNTFGFDFKSRFKKVVGPLVQNGLLIINEKSVRLSDDGLMILDNILLNFFKIIN